MIYRIELYIDNPERASFLREVEGDFNPGEQDCFVVVAREFAADNENSRVVTRAWFLSTSQPSCDGESPPKAPKHKIVSTAIRPGEPTPPVDPTTVGSGGFSQVVLVKMKQSQIRQAKELEHHERFCKTYTDALKQAEGWKSNVEHLNKVVAQKNEDFNTAIAQKDATIKQRYDEIFELKNETTLNRLQIATLQASYSALEKRKSLTERVKAWFRCKLAKQKSIAS